MTHRVRTMRAVAGRVLPPGGGRPLPSVAVQGPGGTGKTVLLAELAAAYRAAGVPVVDAHSAPPVTAVPASGSVASGDVTSEVAVVVDDGHRLSPGTCRRLRDLVVSGRTPVTLAYRPWPHGPELTSLLDAMGPDRHLVVLGHLDADEVQEWAAAELGPAATPGVVAFVAHQTGGLPSLVAQLLRSLTPGRPDGGPTVPADVLDGVRANLVALDESDRALLHALAVGTPLDSEVLGDVLELPSRECADLVTRARGGGLLLPGGDVVPLVHRVLLDLTPADITRQIRRRLLGALLDRGEDALPVARGLAADGVRDPRAAEVLAAQGTSALRADPELAVQLLADAAATGAPVTGLAARRATAAALVGDLDGALQWADRALHDESLPDRARAAAVSAAVLARRGMLTRSAELCRLAGPEHAGSTALALLALGDATAAAAHLGAEEGPTSHRGATMVAGAEHLMAEGVLQSVRPAASASDVSEALSTLTRAATLLEPVGRGVLLLDTPAALAALLALHSGELTAAESVLDRALGADVGGPPCRPRHLLLQAWTAMLRGAEASARALAARARAEAGAALEPRDELFLRALLVGLARRASDAPALSTAWERARQAVLRHPVDLFTLLPLGELVVAGARLADADRLAPHLAQAQALLARLGQPPVWSAPLHWSAAQAAILTDDPAALEPHATALVAAARTSPYAATVATAGRCWVRLLAGQVDAPGVVAAATGLAGVGLAWDGSRLAGQAAARAVDARDRTDLLHCARDLATGEAPGAAPAGRRTGDAAPPSRAIAGPSAQPALSQRERDVAELVVAGQTYREIGGRLFISPKTVEHHVSRMRQRLGATTRSDLLTRLRAELAQHS
ncbi:helix-turn-helix transcriptional regulator [Modestobacter sp. VKM Ac-2983]|uniref:helix-turn-helix transcriptional regulator n=1 Tax=Modestobacter sp. VKM Ac-2983 TaxID=3004137 RepID=UPI0022ABBBB4|nr:helix-turn-helix transcriptional regulator [Modestobacter sp. VKM Ac-2983]MCZ2806978.1 helix-turn-helix transcriptional regulator [Modestobacter sp. VKM Ac-2983]